MPNESLFDSVNKFLSNVVRELNSVKEQLPPKVAGDKSLQQMVKSIISGIDEVQRQVASFQRELNKKLSKEEQKELASILKKWKN